MDKNDIRDRIIGRDRDKWLKITLNRGEDEYDQHESIYIGSGNILLHDSRGMASYKLNGTIWNDDYMSFEIYVAEEFVASLPFAYECISEIEQGSEIPRFFS